MLEAFPAEEGPAAPLTHVLFCNKVLIDLCPLWILAPQTFLSFFL